MNNSKRTPASVAAHVLSDLFSPMLVPAYGMIAALTLTPMNLLPTSPKVWACAGVFFITAVIPILFILTLIRLGKVSDTAITDKNERTLPFVVTILCYVGAAFYVRYLRAPFWIVNFFTGAALVSAFSLLINHWWKISAHAGALGGLGGIFFWMVQHSLIVYAPLFWLCAVIMILGLVGWARLYLEKHTVLQVLGGAVLGFITEVSILDIISRF